MGYIFYKPVNTCILNEKVCTFYENYHEVSSKEDVEFINDINNVQISENVDINIVEQIFGLLDTTSFEIKYNEAEEHANTISSLTCFFVILSMKTFIKLTI